MSLALNMKNLVKSHSPGYYSNQKASDIVLISKYWIIIVFHRFSSDIVLDIQRVDFLMAQFTLVLCSLPFKINSAASE